jgi:hypothetical protein
VLLHRLRCLGKRLSESNLQPLLLSSYDGMWEA